MDIHKFIYTLAGSETNISNSDMYYSQHPQPQLQPQPQQQQQYLISNWNSQQQHQVQNNLIFELQRLLSSGNYTLPNQNTQNFNNFTPNLLYSILSNPNLLSQLNMNLENQDIYLYNQLLLKQNMLLPISGFNAPMGDIMMNENGSIPETEENNEFDINLLQSLDSKKFNSFRQNFDVNNKQSIEHMLPIQAFQPQKDEEQVGSISSNQSDYKNSRELPLQVANSSFLEQSQMINSCSSSPVTNSTKDIRGELFDRRASISCIPSITHENSRSRNLQRQSKKNSSVPRKCHICEKVIRRDISRHLRTHDLVSRFRCIFPHEYCRHKTGQFNRPYDFKKHLLNSHFKFDDPDIKKLLNLKDKLGHIGTCSCGMKFEASIWLRDHILTKSDEMRCLYISNEFIS